eukprot:m.346537 g.346537  ORF g.346537 m.346537 type:complete len:219 (+) comp29514_c0_seq1:960-1616(+)
MCSSSAADIVDLTNIASQPAQVSVSLSCFSQFFIGSDCTTIVSGLNKALDQSGSDGRNYFPCQVTSSTITRFTGSTQSFISTLTNTHSSTTSTVSETATATITSATRTSFTATSTTIEVTNATTLQPGTTVAETTTVSATNVVDFRSQFVCRSGISALVVPSSATSSCERHVQALNEILRVCATAKNVTAPVVACDGTGVIVDVSTCLTSAAALASAL